MPPLYRLVENAPLKAKASRSWRHVMAKPADRRCV
jgi:hypothetical protein